MRMATLLGTLMCAGAAASMGATDLFVSTSGGGTACTRPAPCSLATAIAQADVGDSIYVAAGTYTGTGSSVVSLGKSVSLLGGWDGVAAGALHRDPAAFPTTLDGQNSRRVVTVVQASPTVSGFTVTRGNATGLITECSQVGGQGPAGCGGGILLWGSHAVIEDNLVESNVASSTTPSAKAGIGGGVFAAYGSPVLRRNAIRSNIASSDGNGDGGGIYLVQVNQSCVIEDNDVAGNTASDAGATAWGGGISIHGGDSFLITGNVVEGNVASTGWCEGSGIYVWGSASPTIEGNTILNNGGPQAVYLGYYVGDFLANQVIGNHADVSVMVVNGYRPGAVFRNNVITGSGQCLRLLGYRDYPLTVTVEHNTIVGDRNNEGIRVDEDVTATLTSNIVANSWRGIVDAGAASLTVDRTLFWNNMQDGVRGNDPLDGNPNFVNPLAWDLHIRPGSAAVDTALGPGPATDIDGQPRPAGAAADIGADELPPTAFDFGTDSSPLAAGYARATEASAYSPGKGYGWSAGAIGSRSRSSGTALTRDFAFTALGTFSIDLPNGIYDVTMTFGDASFAHDQMGVFLEGAGVDVVTTAKGQFVTRTYRVELGDGQLTVTLDDLGGSDGNVVLDALAVRSADILKLDFGTSGSPLAPNHQRVTHSTTYDAASGFGWTSGTLSSRDRGLGSELERDFVVTRAATFAVDLPSQEYDLQILTGDATYAHDDMSFAVGGAGSGFLASTSAGEYGRGRFSYALGQGERLNLVLQDQGGVDPNLVINALDVAPRPYLLFDFGTPTSPLQKSHTRVTASTAYDPVQGYGWLSGAVGSRDRGQASDVLRDLNFTRDATFAVDLPNGVYEVQLFLGDRSYPHDEMLVTLEGTIVIGPASTDAGSFLAPMTMVTVTDGQLDITISDQGGTDPYAAICGLWID